MILEHLVSNGEEKQNQVFCSNGREFGDMMRGDCEWNKPCTWDGTNSLELMLLAMKVQIKSLFIFFTNFSLHLQIFFSSTLINNL